MSLWLWLLSLLAAGGLGAGTLQLRHRRRRPPKLDPTLSTVCPACGDAMGPWGEIHYQGEYRQDRSCPTCGRAQSRTVYQGSPGWDY